MIVRILGEGQYDLRGDAIQELKEADAHLFAAVAGTDEDEFRRRFEEVLTLVRQRGTPLPLDRLAESDLVLPPADTTLADARRLFTDHPT